MPQQIEVHGYHGSNPLRLMGPGEILDPRIPYFGIELEMNPGTDSTRGNLLIELQTKISTPDGPCLNAFTCQRDSSIPNGVEIITRPLSFSNAIAFLDGLLPLDHGANETSRLRSAGMHVHISRSALSPNQIGRMVLFVHSPAMFDFMSKIARRRLTNHFCRAGIKRSWIQGFDEFTPEQRQALKAQYHDLGRASRRDFSYVGNHGKYQALNTGRDSTVEVRMFASTNNPAYAKSNIEFCDAMITFCQPMVSPLKDLAVPHKFIDFVTANRATYPNLADRFGYRNAFGEFYATPVGRRARRRRETPAQTVIEPMPRPFSGGIVGSASWGPRTGRRRMTPSGLQRVGARSDTRTPDQRNADRLVAAVGGSRPSTVEIRNYVREHGMPQAGRARQVYFDWYNRLCNGRFVTARGNVLTGSALYRQAIERLRCARVGAN